jgi:multidrug resistance protein
MSDNNGRRLSFIICFVIYMVANIGLALQTNYVALLLLRLLQAFGCSAAIALSAAVVSDISTSAQRGKYQGFCQTGIVLGNAFGPTIGGILSQYLGWRAVFWFLAIFSGTLMIIFIIFFPETCRNVVGNGSIPATGLDKSLVGSLIQRRLRKQRQESTDPENPRKEQRQPLPKRKFSVPNPLKTLRILGEKESAIVLLYNGFFFSGYTILTGCIAFIYGEFYGLDQLHIGLCYLGLGIGCLISATTCGHIVSAPVVPSLSGQDRSSQSETHV